jgi:hypothetical protein
MQMMTAVQGLRRIRRHLLSEQAAVRRRRPAAGSRTARRLRTSALGDPAEVGSAGRLSVDRGSRGQRGPDPGCPGLQAQAVELLVLQQAHQAGAGVGTHPGGAGQPDGLLTGFDALITPTLGRPAVPIGTGDSQMTRLRAVFSVPVWMGSLRHDPQRPWAARRSSPDKPASRSRTTSPGSE